MSKFSPENTHTGNNVQTEKLYLGTCMNTLTNICIKYQLVKKEAMNWKVSGEGFMGSLGGKKENGEMQLYLKINT